MIVSLFSASSSSLFQRSSNSQRQRERPRLRVFALTDVRDLDADFRSVLRLGSLLHEHAVGPLLAREESLALVAHVYEPAVLLCIDDLSPRPTLPRWKIAHHIVLLHHFFHCFFFFPAFQLASSL